jgi:hypothetical protein
MGYKEDIIQTEAVTDFLHDQNFKESYDECVKADNGRLLANNYSIRWRIHTLLWAASYASKLDGDFIEFGGGFGLFSSAIYKYIGFKNLNKKYYLLDSFQGLKNDNLHSAEKHRLNVYSRYGNWKDEVVERFKEYTNMIIIPGYIPDTLPQVNSEKFAFVSIDLNCENPETEALRFVWDRVIKGGIIIFDDYAFPSHSDQKNAHDKFAKENNCVIYTSPTGQGILLKS